MTNKIKILYWLPRILCILAILFVSLFALDSFDGDHSIWEKILAFLIHLIPSFILTILLIIAWRWELTGGILLMAIGILFTPIVFSINYDMNKSFWMTLGIILAITFPFIVTGGLFVWSYFAGKRSRDTNLQ